MPQGFLGHPELPGTPRPGTSTDRAPETGTCFGHWHPGLPRQGPTLGNRRAPWDTVRKLDQGPTSGDPRTDTSPGAPGQPGASWARGWPWSTLGHPGPGTSLRAPQYTPVRGHLWDTLQQELSHRVRDQPQGCPRTSGTSSLGTQPPQGTPHQGLVPSKPVRAEGPSLPVYPAPRASLSKPIPQGMPTVGEPPAPEWTLSLAGAHAWTPRSPGKGPVHRPSSSPLKRCCA